MQDSVLHFLTTFSVWQQVSFLHNKSYIHLYQYSKNHSCTVLEFSLLKNSAYVGLDPWTSSLVQNVIVLDAVFSIPVLYLAPVW